jgi:hypothetical protein
MTIRLISTGALARVLLKSPRSIARWCDDGDVDCIVRGEGPARRHYIIIRDGFARVCGVEIDVSELWGSKAA